VLSLLKLWYQTFFLSHLKLFFFVTCKKNVFVFVLPNRPEGENKAVISLSAAAVQADFEIGEGFVTLVKFSSGNKPPVR
jgi:hypothetical protein